MTHVLIVYAVYTCVICVHVHIHIFKRVHVRCAMMNAGVLQKNTRKKRRLARALGVPTRSITSVERWAVGGWDTVTKRMHVRVLEEGRSERNTENCTGFVERTVHPFSLVVTDGCQHYNRNRLLDRSCPIVTNNHSQRQRVVPDLFTQNGHCVSTQTIEQQWHRLREHLRACHVHGLPVARSVLQLYTNEYCWWKNNNLFENAQNAPCVVRALLKAKPLPPPPVVNNGQARAAGHAHAAVVR